MAICSIISEWRKYYYVNYFQLLPKDVSSYTKRLLISHCHLLVVSRNTSNTYLNGGKVVFLAKASGRGIPPPPPPSCPSLWSDWKSRRHPDSIVRRPKFHLKKRGGEISQKTQNFGPTWTPDPLIESSHKSGHKNGTFTALNKGERHEFCAKLFYIKQKRHTWCVYRQTKQAV